MSERRQGLLVRHSDAALGCLVHLPMLLVLQVFIRIMIIDRIEHDATSCYSTAKNRADESPSLSTRVSTWRSARMETEVRESGWKVGHERQD